MPTLSEVLDSCLNRVIVDFKIDGNKFFPFDEKEMTFIEMGVLGYYKISIDNICLLIISIRKQANPTKEKVEYKSIPYSVMYNADGSVRHVSFDKFFIIFK